MLERFYYMFFLWSLNKTNKSINRIGYEAYFGVSYFQMLNVYVVWRILSHYKFLYIPEERLKGYGIFFAVLILVVNYLFLYRKRREIMIQVDALSAKRKIVEKLFFVGYVFATAILFAVIYVNEF